jgi:nitrate reductase gamma subunit
MTALFALLAVAVLLAIVLIGVGVAQAHVLFGVVIPYAAILIFLVGVIYRVYLWAKAPVPFRIPTTAGQHTSLSWIKPQRLEAPATGWQAIGRMVVEVLLFRSLFRNTKAGLNKNKRVYHVSEKFLWAGALLFHYSFLLIFVRHLRFFMEPVPSIIVGLESWDGFFQLAVPTLLISDVLIIAALGFLLLRRLFDGKMRYLSLASDYFALFLLLGVAGTGIYMRYFDRVDLYQVKELSLGLVTFNPSVALTAGLPFYVHLFFVAVLFAYFPFSKLMHLGGVFLSPTRNMANNNRAKRHVNPWNAPVEVHTYEEWEDEFRDVLKAADYPLERE